jgi:hypothetical protein
LPIPKNAQTRPRENTISDSLPPACADQPARSHALRPRYELTIRKDKDALYRNAPRSSIKKSLAPEIHLLFLLHLAGRDRIGRGEGCVTRRNSDNPVRASRMIAG